ncbi:MAG TPA: aromatic ring-hydroxylating dioxygenase subunit alpha [Novosphingobium sp.]|nr:aromatic ring-hydroxylating dioxygenase subunit alpha [Novosphingobium sp.]
MPFLKNLWYVAANAYELDEPMVSRKICNEQILMFRTSSGEVAAMDDKCPHRFVKLSLGKRVGDNVQCGYHGLAFGRDGSCVDMPNDPEYAIPPCVKSYPAVERYGVIWLWMGDKERADPAKIPAFDFITDPDFAVSQGVSHYKANYQLFTDNLLDLSHVHYLHPHLHQGAQFAHFENKLKVEGDTIWSMLWRHRYPVTESSREMWGMDVDEVEGQGHSRWNAPSLMYVPTAFWEHGKTIDEGIQSPSAHLITPETEYTSHYFWAIGRNYRQDDEEISRRNSEGVKFVFDTQDGPMIESQQQAMGLSTDFLDHKPVILKADAAGVMARRMLKRWIKEEQREAEAASEAIAAE